MSIIQGPAIVIRDGASFYFRDGLKVNVKTDTFDVSGDMHGLIEKGFKSRKITISGKPMGMHRDLAKLFPAIGTIGDSIFDGDVELVIHTKAGQTITYPRSGVTKSPALSLRPTEQLFGGDVEWTVLGAADEEASAANHYKEIATAAFGDLTFEESLLRRYRYTAAYGADPYDVMTGQEGFSMEINYDHDDIPDENQGLADVVRKSVTAMVKFKPSNLSEAQIDALIKLQGAGALMPGDTIGAGTTDLVITGASGATSFTATLYKAGFHDSAFLYQIGKIRQGEVAAVGRRTWTTGAADPLFALTVV